ncbi:MAG: hypothetical protein AAFY17_14120 [Cyanobacteria bacterium J06642_11]
MKSIIDIEGVSSNQTFARGRPFGDEREVIVRRGDEMGKRFDFELHRRPLQLGGQSVEVIRFRTILSPPPHTPGQALMHDVGQYQPEYDMIVLSDAEITIPRLPNGSRSFSDQEVEQIVQRIRLERV